MSTIDLNRRGLFKAGAVIAAASTISSIPVVAQAAEEPEKKIRPLTGKNLKMKDVLDRAREMMMPRCYVCAECNGRGPCIGHVSPETSRRGPIAIVQDGDRIDIDIDAGTLHVDLSDGEIARRLAELPPY